jgi:hypothetical protein
VNLSLRAGPSGKAYDLDSALVAYGTQSAWFIDATNGDDDNPGTQSHPLRTMAEFNARLSGNFIQVPMAVQLVDNVIDSSLQLCGTRFSSSGSLTVSGTLTDTASGSLTSSSAIGPGWQLTTVGIDWTTQSTSSQVRFSTGHVAAISEIVDANNVIVGFLCAPGVSQSAVTPTNGSTVTVATRSRALNPILNSTAQALQNSFPIILQNLSFDAALASQAAFTVAGGCRVQMYGCEMKDQGTFVSNGFNARGSKYTLTTTFSWQSNNQIPTTFGCVVGGTGAVLFNHQAGTTSHSSLLMTGARLGLNGGNTVMTASNIHIRNSANPVVVTNGGYLSASGGSTAAISGSVGNTGIGIDCVMGVVEYFASTKPTVTGASDARVGGNSKTYAQIPFIALDATVPAAITGNGAKFVQIS